MNWGNGCYEETAQQLLPAAEELLKVAAPLAGERVVDLGCGTGNAALLAAAAGADVVGVDPAERLLAVARQRAAAENQAVEFVAGEAASMPLADSSADLLISVFAVIFAPDAQAAAAEMARVVTPTGRIVISAWLPMGAVFQVARASMEAMAEQSGEPADGPPPFLWHDPEALAGLLAPHGFEVSTKEYAISFSADSVGAYTDSLLERHPFWLEVGATLATEQKQAALRERILQILTAENEADAGFTVTSRYLIAEAKRG